MDCQQRSAEHGSGHPFYESLNRILDQGEFDGHVERLCAPFYAETMGRPSLAPGRYFRLLLIGYFEGLDSERAIAWRAADSFALRRFLDMELVEAPPDHSTISRTRRLIDLETHREVFTWILKQLAEAGLVNGKTIGIDATTLEANAALRSIVRRDSGESYQEFLTKLAQASAWRRPLARTWRASIASERTKAPMTIGPTRMTRTPRSPRMKKIDARTRRTRPSTRSTWRQGAVVGVTVQEADQGDTATSIETLIEAAEQVETVVADSEGPKELVADKGYHSNQALSGPRSGRGAQLLLGARSRATPLAGQS